MLALRLPFAASSGVLVTLAVFALLWQLVGVPIDVGPPLPNVKVDWKRLRVDTPVEPNRQEKKERPAPPEIPDVPDAGVTKSLDPPTKLRPARFELVRPPKEKSGPMRPDGDVIPIVRPAPEYPPRPLEQGIEGWVQVRFTVTTIGTVKDAIVVAAEPAKIFDDAALKAIARWRYNPRVENGAAAERVGLQTIIRFRLDE
jgi:periplasmic protein TonB